VARILVWHGYLLSGSGSNIYTANTARIWRAEGHDVLLLCQDRCAHEFTFVDEAGHFAIGNRRLVLHPTGAASAPGRCRVSRPDIGAVLPVYVLDDYEGFVAKRFVDLSEEELEHYTFANVEALAAAIEEHSPDAVIVGHEVMGPYVAKQACARTGAGYLAKLHGSALEYAVKAQERYRRYAREGLSGAGAVAGGSRYMIAEASAILPGWEDRAAVVNPGCDVDLFRPRTHPERDRLVAGYVGKLIAAKGVHNLIAALGLTSASGLALEIVGYGDLEGRLRSLAQAIAAGHREGAEAAARLPGSPLSEVASWLRGRRRDAVYWRRAAAVPVRWHGRLDHGPLAEVLPAFDALVVPSIVPEAFGMVAAEAAACGVLPLVPRHSGIGEVGATLESELDVPGLLTYDPAEPIEGIAAALDRLLGLDPAERASLERAAAAVARARWSWTTVAQRLLELGRTATAAGCR
jgi:glycosyltransferase involved in cell wall biosynthesis